MGSETREAAAARMRAYRDEPGTGHAVRRREIMRREIARGVIVRATVCEKCEASGKTWAHLPNVDDFSSVVWLCPPCYRAVNPRRPPRTYRRGDTLRIAPSYEVMKRDWTVHGLTLTQMAAKYGYANPEQARTAVWNTLRDRAKRRGEWPLTPSRKVNATGIWLAIQMYLRNAVERDPVKVPTWIAERHAPRSYLLGGVRAVTYIGTPRARWRTVFPETEAHYHIGNCKNVTGPHFEMPRSQAEDWGYYVCQECDSGMSVADFARNNDINVHFMWGLSSGRIHTITKTRARQLLTAIGEPIPWDWRLGPNIKGPRRVADLSRHAP